MYMQMRNLLKLVTQIPHLQSGSMPAKKTGIMALMNGDQLVMIKSDK